MNRSIELSKHVEYALTRCKTYISMNKLCEVGVPDIKYIGPLEHRNSALINLTTQNKQNH